jgi:hypothetical protein
VPKASEAPAPTINPLILVVVIIIAFMYFRGGQNAPLPAPKPDDTVPGPVEPVVPAKPTEKQVWESLAKFVELDRLPTLDTHTHQLVKIADELKAMGYLADVTRVDGWRTAKREDITAANKAAVIAKLKGSP